jgi:hypothetical protein
MLAFVDVLLLAIIIGVVFGFGSAVLIFGRRTNIDAFHHPWQWFKTTYTARRWLTNPIKMFVVGMLWQANFQQLALTGPVASLAGDLDYRSRLYLTLANLIGGCVCFYALHIRDFELSLWWELSAYLSLIGTLGMWITLVYLTVPLPNTSYGLNLTEAFVLAVTLIRAPEIMLYKRALRRSDAATQARLRQLLGGDIGG